MIGNKTKQNSWWDLLIKKCLILIRMEPDSIQATWCSQRIWSANLAEEMFFNLGQKFGLDRLGGRSKFERNSNFDVNLSE